MIRGIAEIPASVSEGCPSDVTLLRGAIVTLVLCVTNDFIWWVPLRLYLYDSWCFANRDSSISGN